MKKSKQSPDDRKEHIDITLSHYQKVAKKWGKGPESSMKDQYIRQKEIEFILQEVERYRRERSDTSAPLELFEVGCGNGHLLSILHERFPDMQLSALEWTPELLQLAESRQLPGVNLKQGDARVREDLPREADLIITERVLINILNRDQQVQTLQNIASALRSGGRYIMVESFQWPLDNLNLAAREMCLETYRPSQHNLYLSEDILRALPSWGLREIPPLSSPHTLSTHFFITRILHRSLRPKGGTLLGTQFVKFFDLALPPAIGEFSPILFRLFEKD